MSCGAIECDMFVCETHMCIYIFVDFAAGLGEEASITGITEGLVVRLGQTSRGKGA